MSFVFALFGASITFLREPSLLGIGFSILVAGLAALNLTLDFDFIERGTKAGLAKEFEEIYRPGRPLPLRLPEDSGALKLLQRIRDEAHRFANSFHSLLLKKRISESLLDEIPGVSESRKKALLETFGSVERIRRSSAKQIASVNGIGPKLGEQIAQYLARL